MTYQLNTPADRQAMLRAIGVDSLAALFDSIPAANRLNRPLELPEAAGEQELTELLSGLAARNRHGANALCFLGGGSYDHFVPAVVDALAGRAEFYTSYTPYQPEVAQGNLQAIFEYQTLICQLTGMDVSNASLYDGGSAAIEAALMALSVTGRRKVVVPASLHPEYREILQTYLCNLDAELVVVPTPNGALTVEALQQVVDESTACVLLQHPNFFGCLEPAESAARLVHERGGLLVSVFDPISLGLLKRPGDWGADIAVAEGQSLGTPMLYGGPYLGILACREQFLRRLPGRLAGQTVDRRGRTCYVLTLQTREQHIRRDKATSNICTNQGLLALRASIYLAAQGPQGLRETAQVCLHRSHYAADRLAADPRFSLAFGQPFFKEFVVRDKDGSVPQLLRDAADHGVLAGVPLGRWYPELDDAFLVAVTERRTPPQIDRWANTLIAASQQEKAVHA